MFLLSAGLGPDYAVLRVIVITVCLTVSHYTVSLHVRPSQHDDVPLLSFIMICSCCQLAWGLAMLYSGSVTDMMEFISLFSTIMGIAVICSLLYLRRTRPHDRRPYQVSGRDHRRI